MDKRFSVLMSIYKNETVSNFSTAIDSVINQTLKPNEIILVRDGKVPEELQLCIDNYLDKYADLITYIPLEKNGGLGNALNIGIKKAKNELIARMDTDDICVPNRFELQVNAFLNDETLDVVGGQVNEFIGDTNNIIGQRIVPNSNSEIYKYIKTRSPFNHPTLMYKKSSVMKAGNYIELHYLEDYYLWCRMALLNYKFLNLPEVLVNMRMTEDTYQRRGGYSYFESFKVLEKYKLKNRLINYFKYLKNIILRFCQCVLISNKLRGYLYRKVIRKKGVNNEQ